MQLVVTGPKPSLSSVYDSKYETDRLPLLERDKLKTNNCHSRRLCLDTKSFLREWSDIQDMRFTNPAIIVDNTFKPHYSTGNAKMTSVSLDCDQSGSGEVLSAGSSAGSARSRRKSLGNLFADCPDARFEVPSSGRKSSNERQLPQLRRSSDTTMRLLRRSVDIDASDLTPLLQEAKDREKRRDEERTRSRDSFASVDEIMILDNDRQSKRIDSSRRVVSFQVGGSSDGESGGSKENSSQSIDNIHRITRDCVLKPILRKTSSHNDTHKLQYKKLNISTKHDLRVTFNENIDMIPFFHGRRASVATENPYMHANSFGSADDSRCGTPYEDDSQDSAKTENAVPQRRHSLPAPSAAFQAAMLEHQECKPQQSMPQRKKSPSIKDRKLRPGSRSQSPPPQMPQRQPQSSNTNTSNKTNAITFVYEDQKDISPRDKVDQGSIFGAQALGKGDPGAVCEVVHSHTPRKNLRRMRPPTPLACSSEEEEEEDADEENEGSNSSGSNTSSTSGTPSYNSPANTRDSSPSCQNNANNRQGNTKSRRFSSALELLPTKPNVKTLTSGANNYANSYSSNMIRSPRKSRVNPVIRNSKVDPRRHSVV